MEVGNGPGLPARVMSDDIRSVRRSTTLESCVGAEVVGSGMGIGMTKGTRIQRKFGKAVMIVLIMMAKDLEQQSSIHWPLPRGHSRLPLCQMINFSTDGFYQIKLCINFFHD